MKYHFKIHKEGTGFWAECVEADGWATQGDTREELEKNMEEVLTGVLSEPANSKWIPPLPDPSIKGRSIVEVPVDPGVAFATMVRVNRLRMGITQRQASEKMGLPNLIQYQRLEHGKTVNAQLRTIVKLKKVFPDFSLDAVLA